MTIPASVAPLKYSYRFKRKASNLPGKEAGIAALASLVTNVMPTSVVLEIISCISGLAAQVSISSH
ncbi:hypothetical protein D3C87_1869370 [compost metagenome]